MKLRTLTNKERKALHHTDLPTGQELVSVKDIHKADEQDGPAPDNLRSLIGEVSAEMLASTYKNGVNRGPGSFDSYDLCVTPKS